MVNDKENKPCSIKGKLWVKLKIQKREEQQQQQEYDQENDILDHDDDKNKRVCEVCNKVFKSGKALGGHMRIHVQACKDLLITKKQFKKPKQASIKFKKKQKKVYVIAKSSNKDVVNNKKHKCVMCGKVFHSNKSLFGHMRAHPERDWRGIVPPPAAKTGSMMLSLSASDADIEKIKVSGFATDVNVDSQVGLGEALFNLEKTKFLGFASDDVNDDRKVRLVEALPTWKATARRGRKAILTSSTTISSLEEEELREAVNDLMMLKHGDPFECGSKQKKKVDEFEATNSNSLTYKAGTDDADCVVGLKRERIDGLMSDDHPLMQLRNEGRSSTNGGDIQGLKARGKRVKEYEDDESFDDESDSKKVMVIMNKKRRKKKIKLKDLEQLQDASPIHQTPLMITTSTPKNGMMTQTRGQLSLKTDVSSLELNPSGYTCSTCGKCFPTHQALGGHRSSHNKFKLVIQNSIDESSSADDKDDFNLANNNFIITQEEENKVSEGASNSKLIEATHQCNVCNKIFHSGQALGGHKRCHWSQPSQVMSPDEVISHTSDGKILLDFDLNEPPPTENEASDSSEQVVTYDYASSSHNSIS